MVKKINLTLTGEIWPIFSNQILGNWNFLFSPLNGLVQRAYGKNCSSVSRPPLLVVLSVLRPTIGGLTVYTMKCGCYTCTFYAPPFSSSNRPFSLRINSKAKALRLVHTIYDHHTRYEHWAYTQHFQLHLCIVGHMLSLIAQLYTTGYNCTVS